MKKSGYSFAIEKTNPLNSTDATTIVSSGSMDSPETSSFIYGSCFWKISIEPENGWTAGDTFFRLAVAGGIIVVLIAVLFYLLLYNKDRQNYLNHIASIDYLTGLSSRQALETSFQKYYEEHPEEPYVGIMIDIDNFKQVNDLYGHEAGDHALQALADHISTAFSGDNIRGRFGGDEFFVILKNTTLEHAEETVRTFTEKKISYYTKEGKKTFTISAGYAAYPEQTDDHNQVINLADDALYAGKIDGKHTCMAYRPGMHSSLSRRELGMNMKDLTSCIPIPFIICESGGGFTILASDLEMVRYLGYQDDADMMNWLGNSIQPLLRKEDLELLTSHRFHNGDRISVTMKSGSVRQPQLYCRPYRHEVFGNILILFFIDQDFQKKREEESRSASEKGV
jgi:diguanylate cyclase (GGDEF)-like protein